MPGSEISKSFRVTKISKKFLFEILLPGMHIPVLQKEVIEYLNPRPNENFIDCTIGQGGHALAILEKILPKGKVLGIDWSCQLIQNLEPGTNLILVCDNFSNLEEIVKKQKFSNVQGILFDLGMSSWHLSESGRGFSFGESTRRWTKTEKRFISLTQKREPLDMRYHLKSQLTAEKIVNYWSKFDIERILKEYGEERFSRQVAEKIIKERKSKPIKSTLQLVEVIKKAVPKGYLRGRIHFATRTFQALRIAVNDELGNLEKALPQAWQVLETGGRLVVISFHSLEDRIVKNFFANKPSLKILTKKPVIPTNKEIKTNPRSRSAKLRACQKF